MLVGEVGVQRKEYLYELKFWEIKLIIRGYLRRQHHGWEQARLVAYCAAHAFHGGKNNPTMDKWLTFAWEKDNVPADLPTEEEVDDMISMIRDLNKKEKEDGDTTD